MFTCAGRGGPRGKGHAANGSQMANSAVLSRWRTLAVGVQVAALSGGRRARRDLAGDERRRQKQARGPSTGALSCVHLDLARGEGVRHSQDFQARGR